MASAPVDYQGAYDPAVSYAQGAVVIYNGVTYIAVNPSLGQTPPPVAGLTPALELAYSQIVANVTLGTSRTTIIGPTAGVVLDGATAIVIEWLLPQLQASASQTVNLNLLEDAVDLGDVFYATVVAGSSNFQGVSGRHRRVPAAGSHTYTLQGRTNSGAPIVTGAAGGAGVFVPAQLRVSRA